MTHRIITLAALTLALSSGSLFAGSTEKPTGKFYETPAIHINGHPTIKEGLPRNSVCAAIGTPLMEVTPEVWIYPVGFAPHNDQAKSDGCYELLIAFSDNRVSKIYFINERARKVVQARAKSGENKTQAILATVKPTLENTIAFK